MTAALLASWPVVAALLGILAIARWAPAPRAWPVLPWWGMPALVAVLQMALTWWLWGGTLDSVPVIHDEIAYVLQARLMALGRLAGQAPPLPEFFEQFQVLVAPVLVPKYPPGEGLLLLPGVALGLPGLVPVLLSGLSAALVYALARRFADGATAALTVVLWSASEFVLRFSPSYLSQPSTAALWLLGWWLLDRWRRDRRAAPLAALAFVAALGVIVRPLTMIAFLLPVGVVVLRDLARARAWRQLLPAVAAAAVPLALLLAHDQAATGSPFRMPYGVYTRTYIPFDRYGFGVDSTPPLRALPADHQALRAEYLPYHVAHRTDRLVPIAAGRLGLIAEHTWHRGQWVLPFVLLAGLVPLGAPLAFALASAVLLFLLHLPFAHSPLWLAYYFEGLPTLAFGTALGAGRLLRLAARGEGRDAAVRLGLALCTAGWLVVGWQAAAFRHDAKARVRNEQKVFREMVAQLPAPSIVFLRYAGDHLFHISLLANAPDAATAPVWLVYDRGNDNARLRQLAPERRAFLFDEQSFTFTPMP